ncbi:putative transport transmembrane protein [Pseudooceanicola batsensis HTCC2597]|uniref:Putative transport transmembrane protein n=1 Tax=Pseudooceanicola batsensis (strain ATCC BAA-863 / DSM 15984 / KCTC 12145 / HTCC2597) TaxID=252305 RepID=A3U1K1_PSEBH|nr:tetracycline resistance MFS efflux pump [Pseudooceanicola batsensis]EAQ01782.1 putative transport transmembrane protein [Pseudooceanicola batsensis HTCC2597]
MTDPLRPAVTRKATVFIFATVLIDMIGVGLIWPVIPALLRDVGHAELADASVIGGWMFAAYALAQFLFGPLIGSLSDAYGRRSLLLLAIGGLAVDYVFSALAPTFWLLILGRIIAGICGASHIIATAYLTDITPPEGRARAFGMIGAAFGLGFVIGPALGGLLGEFGPRVPFWAAAALAAANFAFGYAVLPESLPPGKRRPLSLRRANPFGVLRVFRGYPSVLPLTMVLMLYFFAGQVYPTLWTFWGIAAFGWTEATIGATLALFGIMSALTEGLLSGPLVRRMGESRVIVAGLIVAALGAVGFGLAGSLAVVLILLVFVAFEGLVHPCLVSLMTRDVPDDAQGELQGGLASLTNIATLAAVIFYTQVFSWFVRPEAASPMPGAPFLITGGLLALTLLIYLAVRPRGRGHGGLTPPSVPRTIVGQEVP